ncbi:MAG: GldG family protein [Lentisphaerae bacterium]|nr:GldG family protein [Lentisphaerota bacterium]
MEITPEQKPGPEGRSDAAGNSLRADHDRRQARRALWRQRGRRTTSGLNVVLAVALATVLVVMLNYAAYRYFPQRWDLSSRHFFALSDKTMNMLHETRGEVHLITLFESKMVLGDEIRRLLDAYVYAASSINGLDIIVESVDPDRDLVRTRELTETYDVTEPNVVVVVLGGRHKVIADKDFVDYERLIDSSAMAQGQLRVEQKKRGFQGEQMISSAIQGLAQSQRPLVYFLTGHGERDIEEFSKSPGYAAIARALRRDNMDVRPLLLAEGGRVPEDGSALVIAGPDRRLSDAEVARIGEYLDRSGRVLLLTDPGTATGLERLMETWGVKLGRDVVVGLTLTGRELFVREYGDHPITKSLSGVVTMFYAPRSVEALEEAGATERGAADRPRVTPLAITREGWAEFSPGQNPARFDEGTDRAGPVSVAVAVERGVAGGLQMGLRPTRLVVVGDSDFVSNGALQGGVGGNSDFMLNVVNWLVDREELMAIPAKAPMDLRLDMDERQARAAFVLLTVALPLTAAVFGLMVWFARRR